jgi:hypothetical protein
MCVHWRPTARKDQPIGPLTLTGDEPPTAERRSIRSWCCSRQFGNGKELRGTGPRFRETAGLLIKSRHPNTSLVIAS